MCTLLALFPHNAGAVRQLQSLCVHFIYSVCSQRWCCETNAVTVCARIYSVCSQRWCCETNAVTVCARYLLCLLTTLVLRDKCSHCVCTLFTLFAHNVGAVRQLQSLCVHVIYSVCSHRWCCETNAVTVCARYLLCFLTTLVL